MRSRATGSAGSVGRAWPLPPPAPRARRPRCGPVPERNVFLFALREAPSGLGCVRQLSPAFRPFEVVCSPTSTKPGQTEALLGSALHARARALEGSAWRGLLAPSEHSGVPKTMMVAHSGGSSVT